jgi:purine-binding chemotaxis protein CheW
MSTNNAVKTSQYLTFKLDQEVYSLEISKVREVLDSSKVTKVPKMPDFMRGHLSFHGAFRGAGGS